MKIEKLLILIGHTMFWLLIYFAVAEMIGTSRLESIQIINGVRTEMIEETGPGLKVFYILLPAMFLFYVNTNFLLRRYLVSKSTFRYFGDLAVAIALTFAIQVLLGTYSDLVWYGMPDAKFGLGLTLPVYVALLCVSFAYFFGREWSENEKQKRVMHEENLKTELNLLRAQLQPHFLFNVLNNLFFMARETGHVELTNGISSLSSMMQYMVYEGDTDSVPLAREIEYIENYIQLKSLKFSQHDKIEVLFEKKGAIDHVNIAPFLLLPLVENGFKHGINFEAQSSIKIKLLVDDRQLNFVVENTDHRDINKTNKENSGIGLQNLNKRLSLIYPNRHALAIQNHNGLFKAGLTLTFS